MNIETPCGLVEAPDSVRTYENEKVIIKSFTNERGVASQLHIHVRWDDCCKNGHNTLSLTATEYEFAPHKREVSGGCLHERIAAVAPELAFAIPYHLVSAEGPIHYFANTLFFAGIVDCHGGTENVQRLSKDNLPVWQISRAPPYTVKCCSVQPDSKKVAYAPVLGAGKERDLVSARKVANWPEATDEALILSGPEIRTAALAAGVSLSDTDIQTITYLAGDADCFGARQGEQKRGMSSLLMWRMAESPFEYAESDEMPAPKEFIFEAMLGKGKPRELAHARSSAVWPDATDEQLMLPATELEKILAKRLPVLMLDFKHVVETLGFVY